MLDDEQVWSPSGKQLLYTSQDGSGTYSHIFVVGCDGTGRKDVSKGGNSVSAYPGWSPDARSIVYAAYRDAAPSLDIYVTAAP